MARMLALLAMFIWAMEFVMEPSNVAIEARGPLHASLGLVVYNHLLSFIRVQLNSSVGFFFTCIECLLLVITSQVLSVD